ncbi:MAG: cysteine desulfurase family protein [Pseudomonadota bacterium]
MSVYLDYNATAPLRPQARAAMLEVLDGPANPSSVHGYGRKARALLEQAREAVADILAVPARAVTFTASASEANNTVLRGWRGDVLASAIEHPSVLTCSKLPFLPVDPRGILNLAAMARAAREASQPLVSVMAANNETGVIQPMEEITRCAHEVGALVHCDITQWIGRVPWQDFGADVLTFSSHKLGGPSGVGVIVAPRLEIASFIKGGGQEQNRRAGTENVAAIAGFAAALRAACHQAQGYDRLAAWRDDFESFVRVRSPQVQIFSSDAPRLAGVSCLALPAHEAQVLLIGLDMRGVAVSAGSACSAGVVGPSHVLKAMGASPASAVRISGGWQTTVQDFAHLKKALQDITELQDA